ncbi:MAG: single-stranded DNA-binding protein [Spirochaetales bacterium]|jgi:single-strand DNA-binding protein|nr:single-stranded DNA-binding protein [Spirochaetales bacterium]
MADINHVVLVGRLTRDANLKFTSSGLAICEFSIAINRRVKQGDNWVEEAHFFDITLFGKVAEAISKYMLKGNQIAVEGELRLDRWEQDGQKRSKIKIIANNVQLLGSRGGSSGFSGEGGSNRFQRAEGYGDSSFNGASNGSSGGGSSSDGSYPASSDQGGHGGFEDDIPGDGIPF